MMVLGRHLVFRYLEFWGILKMACATYTIIVRLLDPLTFCGLPAPRGYRHS